MATNLGSTIVMLFGVTIISGLLFNYFQDGVHGSQSTEWPPRGLINYSFDYALIRALRANLEAAVDGPPEEKVNTRHTVLSVRVLHIHARTVFKPVFFFAGIPPILMRLDNRENCDVQNIRDCTRVIGKD